MKPVKAVMAKLQRLRENPGARLRVLDLFAGCGGLSLGFDVAGYEIVAAMEIDELAARSHAINFFKGHAAEEIDHHAKPRDIVKVDPEELTADFRLGSPASAIDVIIGGPPCQAYPSADCCRPESLRAVADNSARLAHRTLPTLFVPGV